ncbi:hypothetical protein ACROYT_G018007 [Oculina patagonica]
MASNMDDGSGIRMEDHDTTSRRSSCRQWLLFLARLLLHLGCLGYNVYLIWLLAYLKDNPYYWFLSFIPFFLNLLWPFLGLLAQKKLFTDNAVCRDLLYRHNRMGRMTLEAPSVGVVFNLMACFTMLTRLAYYHRQPDEFIGPRFIIFSLQLSIILFILDCFLQREGKVKNLLNFEDALARMLLDFVDIFNMIEILSTNECGGLGSFVSEESSTEEAIQAFCTLSFVIVLYALNCIQLLSVARDDDHQRAHDADDESHDESTANLKKKDAERDRRRTSKDLVRT